MPVLALRNLSYVTPDGRTLFSDLDLTFGREKTGLIGRNGVGKTTLVKLMLGQLTPSGGAVARDGIVRQLRQEIDVDPGSTVADAFGATEELTRLRRVLTGRGTPEETAEADWTIDDRIAASLDSVALGGIEPDRLLATLSGGQRTRVSLAALVFDRPDMIILDEPTNNLDRDGRAMVAGMLERHEGAAVVISHDRELLRHMDRIVELSSLGIRVYGGNWDFYEERRAAERALAAEKLAGAEREARQVERKIQEARERQAKRDAAGRRERRRGDAPKMLLDAQQQRAENTGGRGSLLADRQRGEAMVALDQAKAGVERDKNLNAGLPSTWLHARRNVLTFDHVTGGHDATKPVIRDLSFAIVGPERIAVTGPNGAGKTTLVRLALGELQPVEGRVQRHVRMAMLDQQVADLDLGASILENFRRLNPAENDKACRSALARFLFRADSALQRVGELSGGEVLRAGLACVLGGQTPPQLLILDEPTNHLDIASIEAIETGLNGFDGALMVVSHDGAFLAEIGIERRIALG